MTYYDILGVPYNATFEQIKKAYREQIRFFHPDVFDGSEDVAKIKTQQLNEAYEVLSNPVKRAAYDSTIRSEKQEAKEETKAENKEHKEEPSKTEDPKQEEKTEPQDPQPEKKEQTKKEKKAVPPETVKKEKRL